MKDIIHKIDKEKQDKTERDIEAQNLATEAREKREQWMAEAGKL